MSKYRLTIEGKTFDVDLTSLGSGTATVEVEGRTYEVQIEDGAPAAVSFAAPRAVPSPVPPAPPSRPPAGNGNGNELRAPMPGLILDVMVREGDRVGAKEPLIKMETMKMENEIRAPRDAVVKRIHVRARQDVDQGAVLVTLEK